MPIRVALAIVAVFLAAASTALAAPLGTALDFTFGCQKTTDAEAANVIWKAKGYDAAWKVYKPLGCLPLTVKEQVTIVRGAPPNATCVVRMGEMDCIWVPAGLIKLGN